ncbi:unnamed protein product, partial [Effrenium voratum]
AAAEEPGPPGAREFLLGRRGGGHRVQAAAPQARAHCAGLHLRLLAPRQLWHQAEAFHLSAGGGGGRVPHGDCQREPEPGLLLVRPGAHEPLQPPGGGERLLGGAAAELPRRGLPLRHQRARGPGLG